MNDIIRVANVSIESFGSLFSLALIVFMLANKSTRTEKHNKLFMRILVCNIAVMLSDTVAYIFRGSLEPHALVLVRVANFLVFCLGYVLLAVFTDYLNAYVGSKTAAGRRPVYVIWGLCAAAIALVVVSQFNGMYYYIDEQNLYTRGDYFWFSQVFGIITMLFNFVFLVRHRKALSRKEMILFTSYIFLPIIAMVIQSVVYGLAVLYIVTTIAIFFVYLNTQSEQAERMSRQQAELEENRISVMLSQIKPHFLYNSLTAIYDLCDNNAEAQTAILTFSDYLRVNMDSLAKRGLIPFEEELAHVRQYLWLEKLRFEDHLDVEYDIRTTGMKVPALTLQPIVENAVRHGITKKKTSGTVRVKTEESEQYYRVIVTDDGVGFDAAIPMPGNRSHNGIPNVRTRLEVMSNGTLTIESEPGRGTTAMITIPKQEGGTV